MDDQNFKKILENIETPEIDVNAKKRALNLASAAFDAHQTEKAQEKQNKFQGSSLLTRLMGNSKTKTHKKARSLMEKKTRKNFIYGGMATAMAVIIVASVSFDHLPQFGAKNEPNAQFDNVWHNITEVKRQSLWKLISKDKAPNNYELQQHHSSVMTYEDAGDPSSQQQSPAIPNKAKNTADKGDALRPYGARQESDLTREMPPAQPIPSEKKKVSINESLSDSGLKPQGAVMAYTGTGGGSSIKDQTTIARTSIAPMNHPISPSIVISQDEMAPDFYQDTGRDKFEDFKENPIKSVKAEPVSTFSIDVDTASYSFIRRQLNAGVLPQKDAVRIEEMINYFDYDYPVAEDKSKPFAPTVTIIDSPWSEGKKLMHIGIKGYDIIRLNEQP